MSVEEAVGRLKTHEERVRGKDETNKGKLLLSHQGWIEKMKKEGE